MQNNKINLINKQTKEKEPHNRTSITALLETLNSKKPKINVNDEKLRLLRLKMERIALDYKHIYRSLIETEIKSNNLNIAAEAIKERNDLVESIYATVKEEVSKEVSQ